MYFFDNFSAINPVPVYNFKKLTDVNNYYIDLKNIATMIQSMAYNLP